MSRKHELVERLRGQAGTPAELADALGITPQDPTFKRALASMVTAGDLIAIGTTRDRRYVPPEQAPSEIDQQLLKIVPCTARQFSDRCHQLGIYREQVQKTKDRLGLVARHIRYRDGVQRWLIEHADSDPRTGRRSHSARPVPAS